MQTTAKDISEYERRSAGHGSGSGTPVARPFWQRLVECLLVGAACGLFALLGMRVFGAVASAGSWWMLLPCVPAGLLVADLTSGAVHWFGDSFFREESPVVGRVLIGPFREHHRDPEGITRHGLLELHGNSCIPVVAALLLAVWLQPDLSAPGWRLGSLGFLFFALGASATNQFHVWAHRPRVPRLVAALQRWQLILPPEVHQRHHSGGFRESYCITTGWWNPLLDRVRFFPRLEERIRTTLRRGDGSAASPR